MIFLRKKSAMSFRNCFANFVGIWLSWVTLYFESFYFFWNIIYSNTCERVSSFIFNSWYPFLIIEILGCFWRFLISFSTGSEILKTWLRFCCSISILRFCNILTKKVLKIFFTLYLFLINRPFLFSVI